MDLIQRYNEPHRFYHNLNHITEMFLTASINKFALDCKQTIAVLYHDAVYNIGSKTNEEDSVKVFLEDLSDNFLYSSRNQISRMIMSTKTHEWTDDICANEIVDLDLSGLGSPWEKYMQDSNNVIKEYLHIYTPEELKKGRTEFLKKFLSRQTIFLTDEFQEKYEDQARLNMKRELEELNEKDY